MKVQVSSLLKSKDKYRKRMGTGYIIHTNKFSLNNDIVYIPPYMIVYDKRFIIHIVY